MEKQTEKVTLQRYRHIETKKHTNRETKGQKVKQNVTQIVFFCNLWVSVSLKMFKK